MAIPSPVQLTTCKSQLWGSITSQNASLILLGKTINDNTPYNLTDFDGLSATFSRTPPSLSLPNYGNVGVVNITANCAWTINYSSPEDINKYFYISSSSVNASAILSGGYGGNGSLNLVRNNTPAPSTDNKSLTITIYFSNGTGGQSSTTVDLSW